jgi:putative colanic acid biosynthesis acetyltransferase WcaF
MSNTIETKSQKDAFSSPWSFRERAVMVLWRLVWLVAFRMTPKFCNRWRIFLLRCFGCEVAGRPFVSATVEIKIPWHLTLADRSCLGDGVVAYNLARIEIGERATVAQETYLCCGTHDLSDPNMPLMTGAIRIGADAFIGARAFVLPGIVIGRAAVVGACAVVTKDVAEGDIVAGNPARMIGKR